MLLQLYLSGKMLSLGLVQIVYARRLQFLAEVMGYSSELGRPILRSIGQFRADRVDTEEALTSLLYFECPRNTGHTCNH